MRMRRRSGSAARAALCALGLVLLVGCGSGAEATPEVTVDTLAGGVERITSGMSGAWAEGEGWRLEEDLRIGRADGTGPDTFGRITALEVDEAGRIYVLDAQAREVRVFGPDGEHVRTVGGEGSGPGELANPVGLALHPETGSLWVVDPGNARYSELAPDGELLDSRPRPFGFFMIPWPGGFDARGRMHDVGAVESAFLARFSSSFMPADTFRPPDDESRRIQVARSDGTPVMTLVAPLSPRLQWRFDPRGFVWIATSDAHRFVQRTIAGDTVRVVQRDYEPVPVGRAEADSVRESIEATISSVGPDAQVDGSFDVPGQKPAFRSFFADAEGRLWVEPYRDAGAPRTLDVYDADGAYLGPVRVDEGLEVSAVLPRVRDGHLYAVVTDELDVPSVVRYRLETP